MSPDLRFQEIRAMDRSPPWPAAALGRCWEEQPLREKLFPVLDAPADPRRPEQLSAPGQEDMSWTCAMVSGVRSSEALRSVGAAGSALLRPRMLALPSCDVSASTVKVTVPDVSVRDSDTVSSLKVFCCGAVAGAVSRTATAPLDRLRTVLVLQAASRTGVHQQPGMLYQLHRIYSAGGWRAFYQGNGTNLLKIAPESAVRFMVFEYLRDHLHFLPRRYGLELPSNVRGILEKFIAGSLAGMTAQFVVYPLEVIKTRLAAASPGYFKGIQDCGARAVRQGGVLVLYRGLGTSLIGMIPYAGIDLCVYTTLRDSLAPSPSPLLLGACGTVSSLIAQVFSFPLGLVRNRLQAQGMSPDRPVLYQGMADCLRKTYRAGGVRGLYDGLLPTLLKVLPATSLSYVVYERCKVHLDVRPHK